MSKSTDLTPLALMQLLADLPPLQHGDFYSTDTLEGCIDDKRQFKMAKRSQGTPQAPVDATVLKRFPR